MSNCINTLFIVVMLMSGLESNAQTTLPSKGWPFRVLAGYQVVSDLDVGVDAQVVKLVKLGGPQFCYAYGMVDSRVVRIRPEQIKWKKEIESGKKTFVVVLSMNDELIIEPVRSSDYLPYAVFWGPVKSLEDLTDLLMMGLSYTIEPPTAPSTQPARPN